MSAAAAASKMELLERAANWCDLKGVDYSIVRDGTWSVFMHLSDKDGTFSAYYDIPITKSAEGAMERALDRACLDARKSRQALVRYSKAA